MRAWWTYLYSCPWSPCGGNRRCLLTPVEHEPLPRVMGSPVEQRAVSALAPARAHQGVAPGSFGGASASGMPVKVSMKAMRSHRSWSDKLIGFIRGERLGRSIPPVS